MSNQNNPNAAAEPNNSQNEASKSEETNSKTTPQTDPKAAKELTPAQQTSKLKGQIKNRLIGAIAILAAIDAGTATDHDKQKLESLNSDVASYSDELQKLGVTVDLDAMTKELRERSEAKPSSIATVVFPRCVGPLVMVMCNKRDGLPDTVVKYRRSVTDPSDGREWVVYIDGVKVVAEKSPVSGDGNQVMLQYERLRKTFGDAKNRADSYRSAYESEKGGTVPELRESMRSEVERILAEEKKASAAFYAFEKDHPECRKVRLLSEARYFRAKQSTAQKSVDIYTKAEADWLKKTEDARGAFKGDDEHFRDDNLQESLVACRETLAKAVAARDEAQGEADELEAKAAKIKVAENLPEIIVTVPGDVVSFA